MWSSGLVMLITSMLPLLGRTRRGRQSPVSVKREATNIAEKQKIRLVGDGGGGGRRRRQRRQPSLLPPTRLAHPVLLPPVVVGVDKHAHGAAPAAGRVGALTGPPRARRPDLGEGGNSQRRCNQQQDVFVPSLAHRVPAGLVGGWNEAAARGGLWAAAV